VRWERVDRAEVPGGGVMDLFHDGRAFAIHVDGRRLMASDEYGSERALAELGCAPIADRAEARVLIGGLGMGFTLSEALARVGPEASVTVAELMPDVVRWNRGPLGEAAGRPLIDPRANVYAGDVADLVRRPPAPWDAILLDVDNGPTGLTRSTNEWLYGWEGLAAAHAALSAGGVLGVWSAWPDSGFARRLARAGFAVDEVEVRSRGKQGGQRHVVWIGTRGHAVRGG